MKIVMAEVFLALLFVVFATGLWKRSASILIFVIAINITGGLYCAEYKEYALVPLAIAGTYIVGRAIWKQEHQIKQEHV